MGFFNPVTAEAASSIVVGTTDVTGGTASGILWSNAGVLAAGPATTDASGNLTAIRSITTPAATNIGINSAGAGVFFGTSGNATQAAVINTAGSISGFEARNNGFFGFSVDNTPFGTLDTMFTRNAAANIQLGAAAVDTGPVAQTLSVQNTLAGGTSNVAGANWTQQSSAGKGTGVGGDWAIQIAPAGSTGTTVNTFVDGIRVKGAGSVLVGLASVATNATDGFIYIAANAGTPTGTPTTRTGYIPAYIDTTNSQLWLYISGAWRQPKTPAGAALITWQ